MGTGYFHLARLDVAISAALLGLLAGVAAYAQTDSGEATPPETVVGTQSAPKASVPALGGFRALTPSQQHALAPLASHWSGMRETQRLKWLEMVRNFHAMPPAEQERLHGRMLEWSSLSYEQRMQARLNFAEASKLDSAQKKAQWEAYQALSTEERNRLKEVHSAPPGGVARAVRPVPPQRLATLPPAVTPRPRPTIGVSASQFDQKTLLPQHLSVRPAARAPVAPAASLPPTLPDAPASETPVQVPDPAVAP